MSNQSDSKGTAPMSTRPEPGPLARLLVDDHRRLESLLDRSVATPGRIDSAAYEEFRAGLLRHIGIEEKILFKVTKRRRGGVPHPAVRSLHIEHAAIGSLLVPTPDAALVDELRDLLAYHNRREEGPGAFYDACERLAGDEIDDLLQRAHAAPIVPLAAHFDGEGTWRRAADALRAAHRSALRHASRVSLSARGTVDEVP